jgi:hypothetical protein
MNEKPLKVDIGFQEALRRIAKTPKNGIVNEKLVNQAPSVYNEKKAAEKPPRPVKNKSD